MTNINHELIRPGKFPYVARYKDRYPDPGECKVLSINWEEERIDMSNGYCRYWPKFEEVDIYRDPKPLLEFKKKFDEELAKVSDEELHAEFDAITAERMSRIPTDYPPNYRLLVEGELTQQGDLYRDDGRWIYNETSSPFAWTSKLGYFMARHLS